MVPAQTTMRGFGGDGPRRRTATLRSYRPFDERPRQAALPAAYRELLESIYANVGLTIEARAEPAPVEGEALAATRRAALPRLPAAAALGRAASSALKRAVRHLLSRHVDVVYADIDLAAVADVDKATAAAE